MEIIALVIIVALIYAKLNSILGRPIGISREDLDSKALDLKNTEPVEIEAKRIDHMDYAIDEKFKPIINNIERVDQNFNFYEFLDGTCEAFKIVVEAFNTKNPQILSDFLTKEMWSLMQENINNKNNPGISFVKFLEVKLEEAREDLTNFYMVIKILTQQKCVNKDVEEFFEVLDLWTFEKNIQDKNNNWLLSKIS